MSNKPNPVAETAVMLAMRTAFIPYERGNLTTYQIASLASDLHRLAPACKRHGVAQCNGELRDGQRDAIHRCGSDDGVEDGLNALDAAIAKNGERLDKRVAKLSERLAPLGLKACSGGDPRGACLWLESTDPARAVPRNGWGEHWYIG